MLNALAKRIYDFNVTMGWHSEAPDLAKYLMNLHSEVSELWEAWRAGKVHVGERCRPNMIGSCAEHGMDLGTDAVCRHGRDARAPDLCDKADKMRALDCVPLTCIEEELADILIRTLDTAHAWRVDIDRAVAVKMAYNATRGHRHGGKLA